MIFYCTRIQSPNPAYPGEFLHINNQRAHNIKGPITITKNIFLKGPNENPQRANLGRRATLWTTLVYNYVYRTYLWYRRTHVPRILSYNVPVQIVYTVQYKSSQFNVNLQEQYHLLCTCNVGRVHAMSTARSVLLHTRRELRAHSAIVHI